MKIETSVNDSVTVVDLEGNLDTNTSVDAQDHLNGLMDDGVAKLLVDFTKVDFVSSAGLRVLLATAKRLGGIGGSLRICGLNEEVNEVFEISGFSTILDVFPTRNDALQGF
jgi:anti-sigma B factor antagonist